MDYDKIILNVPHSSLFGLYDSEYSGWKENPAFECDCVIKWTDWATDNIFAPNHNLKVNVDMHIFQLSRFIIDAERLEHDPLEAKGQGIIYTDFGGFHREVSSEKKEFLMNIYHDYIRGIKECLTKENILIDCHSFPPELSDVDVCIGFNDDWSKPEQETINMIASKFIDAGYEVGINEPYSNSLSPACTFPYHSIMIEVNKRIYMNTETFQLLPEAERFTRTVNDIYATLLRV